MEVFENIELTNLKTSRKIEAAHCLKIEKLMNIIYDLKVFKLIWAILLFI
jgi:hypothetical protein